MKVKLNEWWPEQEQLGFLERHAVAGLVIMVAITIGCGVMAIWSHYNFRF